MPYVRESNMAMYNGADWSGYIKTVSNCTAESARIIATKDPAIDFFFYCRESMVLSPNSGNPERYFAAGDAVFFSGEPWWGSAPQCDGYLKDGISTAYCTVTDGPEIAGEYTTAQGLNAVDIVCLFAANLNLTTTGDYVRLAPDVDVPTGGTLAVAHSDYIPVLQQAVPELQAKGITVLLTFLNNWDTSGWSEFTSAQDAENFALQLKYVVDTYGLDGIDIDDEYSTGSPEDTSLVMVTSMMKSAMPDAVISKALWSDLNDFNTTYNGTTLAENLTYGWEMSYDASAQDVLPPCVKAGMSPDCLSKGCGYYSESEIDWLKQNGYLGYMVYAFQDPDNQAMFGQMVNAWMGPGNWNPVDPTKDE